MPIPEQVVKLLETPALWACAGTRSAEMVPAAHLAWGVRITPDRLHVDVFIPAPFTVHLKENIADNAWCALTGTEPVHHETYQLKGHVTEVREPTAEERAFQAQASLKKLEYFREHNLMPPNLLTPLSQMHLAPSTLLRLRVEEVFVQTPGPTAGKPLSMEAA